MAVNKIRRNGSYAPLSAHYYKDDAVDEAGLDAELLYVRGLAFCADVLSDGFISDRQLVRFVGVGMTDAVDRAKVLVEVRLWERVEGGYRVRSWLDWNRSRAEITDYQARDAARKRGGSESGRNDPDPPDDPPRGGDERSDRNPNGIRVEGRPESEPPSDRTSDRSPEGFQPRAGARARTPRNSTPRNSSGAPPRGRAHARDAAAAPEVDTRAAPLPDDWAPTDAHRRLAERRGVDVDHETEQFRAYSAAYGKTYANPHEAFRWWLGRASSARNGQHLRPVPDTEPELTPDDVDRILGDGAAPPVPPREIEEGDKATRDAWYRTERPRWHAERRERALAKLAGRA